MAKYIISGCRSHSDCTVRLSFGDDSAQRVPFPDWLEPIASREFPGCVCIAQEHLPGKMELSQTSP